MRVALTLVFVVGSLGGCAFTPQSVAIKPAVSVASSQVGNGKGVALNVVDERPKKTLGTVGASGVGADISLQNDLVGSVQDALREGLSRLSFTTSARGAGSAELRVEIRNVDYTIIRGFWAGTLRVDAGLKAICIRGNARPYEKLHTGEFVESVQIVQQGDANAKYINTAVSAAVNSLLADRELATCLAA